VDERRETPGPAPAAVTGKPAPRNVQDVSAWMCPAAETVRALHEPEHLTRKYGPMQCRQLR